MPDTKKNFKFNFYKRSRFISEIKNTIDFIFVLNYIGKLNNYFLMPQLNETVKKTLYMRYYFVLLASLERFSSSFYTFAKSNSFFIENFNLLNNVLTLERWIFYINSLFKWKTLRRHNNQRLMYDDIKFKQFLFLNTRNYLFYFNQSVFDKNFRCCMVY